MCLKTPDSPIITSLLYSQTLIGWQKFVHNSILIRESRQSFSSIWHKKLRVEAKYWSVILQLQQSSSFRIMPKILLLMDVKIFQKWPGLITCLKKPDTLKITSLLYSKATFMARARVKDSLSIRDSDSPSNQRRVPC